MLFSCNISLQLKYSDLRYSNFKIQNLSLLTRGNQRVSALWPSRSHRRALLKDRVCRAERAWSAKAGISLRYNDPVSNLSQKSHRFPSGAEQRCSTTDADDLLAFECRSTATKDYKENWTSMKNQDSARGRDDLRWVINPHYFIPGISEPNKGKISIESVPRRSNDAVSYL